MTGVLPIYCSSSAKESLFASSNFSRSILICLSIGASWHSGFVYLTKSCSGPISFITEKYSPFFNKVLTPVLPVFPFLIGIWYKSFSTCFSSVFISLPFHRYFVKGDYPVYCLNLVILVCSEHAHCLIVIDLDMFNGFICHNNIEDTWLNYFITSGDYTFICCTTCVDSFMSDRGFKDILPRCACLYTLEYCT